MRVLCVLELLPDTQVGLEQGWKWLHLLNSEHSCLLIIQASTSHCMHMCFRHTSETPEKTARNVGHCRFVLFPLHQCTWQGKVCSHKLTHLELGRCGHHFEEEVKTQTLDHLSPDVLQSWHLLCVVTVTGQITWHEFCSSQAV